MDIGATHKAVERIAKYSQSSIETRYFKELKLAIK